MRIKHSCHSVYARGHLFYEINVLLVYGCLNTSGTRDRQQPSTTMNPPPAVTKALSAAKASITTAAEGIERLPQTIANQIRPTHPQVAACVEAIIVDSPLTLCFVFTCVCVHATDVLLVGALTRAFFAVPPWWSFACFNPLSYWRLLSHVLGHASWSHLHGNVSACPCVHPAVISASTEPPGPIAVRVPAPTLAGGAPRSPVPI